MQHETALQLHDNVRQTFSIRSEFVPWIERPRADCYGIQPGKL
jgi:hypothetical protein